MSINSSDLALTGRYPPSSYTNFSAFKELILAKAAALDRDGKHQHVALKHVTPRVFDYIEQNRWELGRAVRLMYFPDIETLIVKIPSGEHEVAHRLFSRVLERKFDRMNVSDAEFLPLGATIYTGPTNSRKESDSCWKNTVLRPQGYPYLVIETGVSESMPRLIADAAWWFANSNGAVRLVLLIKVDRQRKEVMIVKYDRIQVPATRSNPVGWRPRKLRTIILNRQANPPTIQVLNPNGRNATGPPLVLEFNLVIGRNPNPPMESDITFTSAELLDWAGLVFRP